MNIKPLAIAAILTVAQPVSAELYVEVGVGYNSNYDTLENSRIDLQPLASFEAGWVSNSKHGIMKGVGVDYLHLSNPTARDRGINMGRITKRFSLF
jgi:hypothetical protein